MHVLPKLPYAYNALEPVVDEKTMTIHHTKHHQAYIDKLNVALEQYPDLQGKSVEELIADIDSVPEAIRTAVRNNGGGHLNHSFFWEILTPGGSELSGALKQAIEKGFGSVDSMKEKFAAEGAARFGSGWVWLVVDGGKLEILSSPNQDNPISSGKTPILGLDVWEHAYYLQYQNRRPDYIKAWWGVVHWSEVSKRFDDAK
jgi:Fe-Mn family superoxide dismutase